MPKERLDILSDCLLAGCRLRVIPGTFLVQLATAGKAPLDYTALAQGVQERRTVVGAELGLSGPGKWGDGGEAEVVGFEKLGVFCHGSHEGKRRWRERR